MRLVQKWYSYLHDRYVQFAPRSIEEDEFYLDRTLLFRSVVKMSAAERYNNLLLRYELTYKAIVVNEWKLHIQLEGLENTIFSHQTTLLPASKRYCNRPSREEKGPSGKEPCYENESKATILNFDDLNILDKTVRHIGSGLRLKYVPRWCGYSKADDTVKLPHHVRQSFIAVYWHWFEKRWERKSCKQSNIVANLVPVHGLNAFSLNHPSVQLLLTLLQIWQVFIKYIICKKGLTRLRAVYSRCKTTNRSIRDNFNTITTDPISSVKNLLHYREPTEALGIVRYGCRSWALLG